MRGSHSRRSGSRFARALGAALLVLGVFAAVAIASSSTISNGYVDSTGVFGPRHSVSRVYVHDYGGAYNSCEDAWNDDSSKPDYQTWAQAYAYCVFNGATWHDFCACELRLGWNGAQYSGGLELMDGHEDW